MRNFQLFCLIIIQPNICLTILEQYLYKIFQRCPWQDEIQKCKHGFMKCNFLFNNSSLHSVKKPMWILNQKTKKFTISIEILTIASKMRLLQIVPDIYVLLLKISSLHASSIGEIDFFVLLSTRNIFRCKS